MSSAPRVAVGYRTVAVFSTADAGAQHVREAEQAVEIGEALAAHSYLNQRRVRVGVRVRA